MHVAIKRRSVPMHEPQKPKVAIVDYGMGNLFSVKLACESVGLYAVMTSSKQEVLSADAVILPGVGAYGDAMRTLRTLGLMTALQSFVSSGKPLMGICLGIQLLMTEGYEFGRHEGLGIIRGQVVPFDHPVEASGKALKVPQVGWNRIYGVQGNSHPISTDKASDNSWSNSLLSGLTNGEYMYFVHSFYVKPEDSEAVLSISRYGHIEFCSSLRYGNIFACQFHPERSGPQGLRIYRNLAASAHIEDAPVVPTAEEHIANPLKKRRQPADTITMQ